MFRQLHPFEEAVAAFCHDYAVFNPERRRVLVGLSGGADSVALLAVLAELGVEVTAAHCNFGLRGRESERDEQHCRQLCRQLQIPLLVTRFDVEAERAATGASLEMACRKLRYSWWRELIDDGHADCVAVGHHVEDNVETLFLNLFRGSGLRGLKGMLPVAQTECTVVRPLLERTRKEIENYLTDRGLIFVTDHTNAECEARRNLLRNVIIPAVEAQWPGAIEGVERSLGHLRDDYEYFENQAFKLREQYVGARGEVRLARLVVEQAQPLTALCEVMRAEGLTYPVGQSILESVAAGKRAAGQRFRVGEREYELHNGELLPVSQNENYRSLPQEVRLDTDPFMMREITREEFERLRREGSADRVFFDAAILDGNPEFTLDYPRKADRVSPYGMRGTKLLSDLLKEAGIPASRRAHVKLLRCSGEIVWVIGLRATRHFAVTASTQRIIVVEIEEIKA